jgi:hypothetical protein
MKHEATETEPEEEEEEEKEPPQGEKRDQKLKLSGILGHGRQFINIEHT